MGKINIVEILAKVIKKAKDEYSDDGRVTPPEAVEISGFAQDEISKELEGDIAIGLAGNAAWSRIIAEKMGEPLDD